MANDKAIEMVDVSTRASESPDNGSQKQEQNGNANEHVSPSWYKAKSGSLDVCA
jgi:hypothetical protein